jgi:hypothetical protein
MNVTLSVHIQQTCAVIRSTKPLQVEMNVTLSVHHIRSMNAPKTKVVMVGGLPELGNWDINKVQG